MFTLGILALIGALVLLTQFWEAAMSNDAIANVLLVAGLACNLGLFLSLRTWLKARHGKAR